MKKSSKHVPSIKNAVGNPTNEIIVALSREFGREMRRTLDNITLAMVDRKNFAMRDSLGYSAQCATHDYTDAHEVMATAFARVVGRKVWSVPSDHSFDATLINEAWEDRKLSGFLDRALRAELLKLIDDSDEGAKSKPVVASSNTNSSSPDDAECVASVAVTESIFESFVRVTANTRDALYQLRELEQRLLSTLSAKRVMAALDESIVEDCDDPTASTHYALRVVRRSFERLDAIHNTLDALSTEIDNANETLRDLKGCDR